ncbi:MAG TPA: hypothetical protein VFP98_03500, partial [Candidatus Polarisedimenticolia bacterium]|nr:hypothetical protein [Candidatus Polarisedimenticolia bacterium]
MSMRLGETLVQRGLLSEEQVKKALDAQLIYGAHLGTCLIELGMLGEETLGGVLSDIFGVPYARPNSFENIPEPVIGALPPRFAAKHHVVPIGVDDRLMRLAMIDPRNLHALDEVSFASGCRIEPWVSPEVRIQQALERYYDVPRRMRYVAMVRAGSSEATDRGSGSSAGAGAEARGSDPARRAGGSPVHMDPEEALARLCDRLCGVENADELAAAALDFVGARAERVLLFRVEGVSASLWMVR